MQTRQPALFLPLFAALFLCCLPAFAAGPYDRELETLRLEESDLEIGAGWPLDFTIDAVESIFAAPLKTETLSTELIQKIETSTGSAALLKIAHALLEPNAPPSSLSVSPAALTWPGKIPEQWRGPVAAIAGAAQQARKKLSESLNTVSATQRNNYLTLMEWTPTTQQPVIQDISSRRIQAKYAGMKNFDMRPLLDGAHLLMATIDRNLPRLQNAGGQWTGPVTLNSSAGKILLGGSGDDTYTTESLKDIAVLIDAGGNNTYEGQAGAALDGEVRVVIDLGDNVSANGADIPANAGAGIFGIGLFYAPSARGVKTFNTGAFSQGCGLGGVGGLFINGETHLKGDRYVQGAASFGAGLFSNGKSKNSTLTATRSAQGAGFARGVGVFHFKGDHAQITGGLVDPDPREPQGTVSLCQGVGFGRRAYSGGGVGVAVVEGAKNSVKGSYFAQGSGYWHALGAFSIKGDGNTVQARRYDQGSGIHSAFGHFRLDGDDNRVLNWGVGPAYGWDRGVGSSHIRGDRNEIQVEWGAAAASIGSISFSTLRGHHNKLKVPDFANGSFTRDEPGYSFHIVEGTANVRLMPLGLETSTMTLRLMTNPWGVYLSSGVEFVQELKLEPPVWEALPQEVARLREMVDLQQQLSSANTKASSEKAADLLDIAAAFSLDKDTPRRALESLVSLPTADLPALIDVFEPAAVEQLIQMRTALAAYGAEGAQAVLASFEKYPFPKKAILLNQLTYAPPALSYEKLKDLAALAPRNENDTRLKLGALRILGGQMNRDTGEEPGLRACYEAVEKFLSAPEMKRKETAQLLQRLRLQEGYAILSVGMALDAALRAEFIRKGPKDATETIGAGAANYILDQLLKDPTTARTRLQEQLTHLTDREKTLREQLRPMLERKAPKEVATAVVILGNIGHPDDAEPLLKLLNHERALVREAAACALGRMGAAGLKAIETSYVSLRPRERAYALVAVSHAIDRAFGRLIQRGLKDDDARVRLTAISTLNFLPPVLEPHRNDLIKQARQALRKEKKPAVQTAGFLLK